jgi:hypothetical protein
MNNDFKDIIAVFTENGVDFIIVGAHALAIHGVARATGDIDLLVRPTEANAARVYQALLLFGAPVRSHGIQPHDFEIPGTVYQMGLPPSRIDILTQIDGVSFDAAWRGRVLQEVDGITVGYLGRDEFTMNKRASGRPKDLADLALLAEPEQG